MRHNSHIGVSVSHLTAVLLACSMPFGHSAQAWEQTVAQRTIPSGPPNAADLSPSPMPIHGWIGFRTVNLIGDNWPQFPKRLQGIADAFYDQHPQNIWVIGMQEVKESMNSCPIAPTSTSGGKCLARVLGSRFDRSADSREYITLGIASDANWKIVEGSREAYYLGRDPVLWECCTNWSKRRLLGVKLRHVDRDLHFWFFTTHLSHGEDHSDHRRKQVEAILNRIRQVEANDPGNLPPVIVGDFNFNSNSDNYALMGEYFDLRAYSGVDCIWIGLPHKFSKKTRGFSSVARGVVDLNDNDKYDAAVGFGQYAYFFKGNSYLKYDLDDDKVVNSYPKDTATNWFGWPDSFRGGIDAAVRGAGSDAGHIFFLKNNMVLKYSMLQDRVVPGYPKTIKELWANWPDDFSEDIEAAVLGMGKFSGYAYFFKNRRYIKLDWRNNAVVDGYPKGVPLQWPGWPDKNFGTIGFALSDKLNKPLWPDSRYAYFFNAGKGYIKFDWDEDKVVKHGGKARRDICKNWYGFPGCYSDHDSAFLETKIVDISR